MFCILYVEKKGGGVFYCRLYCFSFCWRSSGWLFLLFLLTSTNFIFTKNCSSSLISKLRFCYSILFQVYIKAEYGNDISIQAFGLDLMCHLYVKKSLKTSLRIIDLKVNNLTFFLILYRYFRVDALLIVFFLRTVTVLFGYTIK